MKKNNSNKKRKKKYKGALDQSERDKKKSKVNSEKSKFFKDKNVNDNIDTAKILNPYFGKSDYLYQFESLSRIVPVKNYLLPSDNNLETIKQAKSLYNNYPSINNTASSLATTMATFNNPSGSEIAALLAKPMTIPPKWHSENLVKYADTIKSFRISTDINTKLKSINFESLKSLSNYKSYSESASKLIYYSQKSLSTFPIENIGNKINLESETKSIITNSFNDLSFNFSNLLASVNTNPSKFTDLIPLITKESPREIYTGANLLESISGNEEITIEEEVLKKEIIYENEYTLSEYLPKIHPSLLKMWKGAIETYNSTNSDKVRQFTVSLRELFTHIMHLLAPNDEIKIWSTNTNDYHEGRPTRKARLSYICRNIQEEPFRKFVQSDIQTTIEFIDIFQHGTHSLNNDFLPEQLIAMKSKAESTIKFLLEIEFSINRL